MLQLRQVLVAGDLDRPELFEVGRHPLNVEQTKTPAPHAIDQRDERDLRGIRHVVKHRFAEKRAAEMNAVEPADQRSSLPRLHRMRDAETVQRDVALENRVVDPRAIVVFPLSAGP